MNISKTIYSCKNTEYSVVYTPDVVFAHRDCGDLTMQIVSPIALICPAKRRPSSTPSRRSSPAGTGRTRTSARPLSIGRRSAASR